MAASMTFLGETVTEILHDFAVGEYFLDKISNTEATKAKQIGLNQTQKLLPSKRND